MFLSDNSIYDTSIYFYEIYMTSTLNNIIYYSYTAQYLYLFITFYVNSNLYVKNFEFAVLGLLFKTSRFQVVNALYWSSGRSIDGQYPVAVIARLLKHYLSRTCEFFTTQGHFSPHSNVKNNQTSVISKNLNSGDFTITRSIRIGGETYVKKKTKFKLNLYQILLRALYKNGLGLTTFYGY